MIYGSVCSGIEAATHAWHPLGWKASFFSEIEDFPRKVLAHHYPHTPLHGDFTTIKEGDYEPIKLLVGGTPCQSFSVAGLRAGLDDPRGNLMLEFGALAKRLHPKWLVWENVPGVLSSNGGKDFATFLAMLGELGYGFAYRVLDAQHFGVPQRRRRVFVIGCIGDFRSAAAVLFERNSLQGNSTQSKSEGQEVTGTLTRGFGDRDLDLDQIAGGAYEIRTVGSGNISKTLMAEGNKKDPEIESYAITYELAHAFKVRGGCEGGGKGYLGQDEQAFTLSTGADQQLFHKMQVRRLMPIECERLQGFREIQKYVIIKVCLDHQKNYVVADSQNLRLQNAVLNVGKKELKETVFSAELNLNAKNQLNKLPVVVNALIDLELLTLQIRSQEKLILSVNLAEKKNLFLPLHQIENIAQLIVQVLKGLEVKAVDGKVELQQNIKHSFHQKNGNIFVNLYGQEIEELAKDAELFMKKVREYTKFITLEAGLNSQNYEKKLATLCCFVTVAISSFIQKQISNESSYEINLSITNGFTNIPGASDSARYKALGNSMAVPVMKWIGERIDMVEKMQKELKCTIEPN